MTDPLGHKDRFFDWCPYCPRGLERMDAFYRAALRALQRRLKRAR